MVLGEEKGYVVGEVAGVLAGSTLQRKTTRPTKKEQKTERLAALFSTHGKATAVTPTLKTANKAGFSPPQGIVHEALQKDDAEQSQRKRKLLDTTTEEEDDSLGKKRMRRDRRDKANDDRTVFVGNLPTSITKKTLKKLFTPFGEIDTVRLRCAPRADMKTPKKLAIIKKEFHEDRHNLAGFVMFKNVEDCQKATKLNGQLFEGYHIRVDLANLNKQHDHGRSVFVGNLPFDAEEDEVRKHFEEYGEVESVRLIRDRNTSIGKGFGYVLFKDKSSVSLTLKFAKHSYKGRELRVQRSTEHPNKPKTVKGKSANKRQTNGGDSKVRQKVNKQTNGGDSKVRQKVNKASNTTSHFQGKTAIKTTKVKKPRHKPRNNSSVEAVKEKALPGKPKKTKSKINPKQKPGHKKFNAKGSAVKASTSKRNHLRFT